MRGLYHGSRQPLGRLARWKMPFATRLDGTNDIPIGCERTTKFIATAQEAFPFSQNGEMTVS